MLALLRTLRGHLAALRMLLVLTVVLGVGYPLLVLGIAQLPGLSDRADGSLVRSDGRVVGSSLLGQNFTDARGNPLPQYFQPRPSAAGAAGYDPTASGASDLGPESVVDTLPDPKDPADHGRPSLLTQVCARSAAIGAFDGVSGARPYCADGVGAVLAVFYSEPGYTGTVTRVVSLNQECPATVFLASYDGVRVQCASYGVDYSAGRVVPIRGSAPADPAVPADAVTASGSGLDPDISPAYAAIQVDRVARARHVGTARIAALVAANTDGRELGFLGEPTVNVLRLNILLDQQFPLTG